MAPTASKKKPVQPYETNTPVRGAFFCRAIGTSVAVNNNEALSQRLGQKSASFAI
jgi:hypothetical protein